MGWCRRCGVAGGERVPPAPHRLHHLTACFIQNGQRGPKIGETLGYWTLQSTFTKKVFLIRSFLLLEPQKSKMDASGPQNVVLLHLSEGQLSKETFVQGTLVQEDFCPRRHWSKETFVQGASLKQHGC